MQFVTSLLSYATEISNFLWGNILYILLIFVGLFFAIAGKFSQITLFKQGVKALLNSNSTDNKHLSGWQTVSATLGSLIGIGSIAGMAIAVSKGGPGAIFWLWIVALLGMGLSLVENTLGQVYKKEINGNYVGGPAYYISQGLKNKWFALVFAVSLLFSYGAIYSGIQANTIGILLNTEFNISKYYTAITLTVLTFLIILGGLKRIATLAAWLLPLMGLSYIGLTVVVIVKNITVIPSIFALIVSSAFGLKQAVYGTAGGLLINIFVISAQRALYASESGLGSAPNITASSYVKHPVNQGLIAMMMVFIVIFVICTSTAIIVLTGGLYTNPNLTGIALVEQSLITMLGKYSIYVLTVAILVFGFTSIVGNYAYAESNMVFLSNKRYKLYLHIIKVALLLSVYFGTLLPLNTVWGLADLATGIMIFINAPALILLSKVFFDVLKDYKEQIKQGKTPEFKASKFKNLPDYTKQIWK